MCIFNYVDGSSSGKSFSSLLSLFSCSIPQNYRVAILVALTVLCLAAGRGFLYDISILGEGLVENLITIILSYRDNYLRDKQCLGT